MRMPTGEILVTPSGMIYEDMEPDDVLVMDIDGNIIEGTNKPSSDTPGIIIYFQTFVLMLWLQFIHISHMLQLFLLFRKNSELTLQL